MKPNTIRYSEYTIEHYDKPIQQYVSHSITLFIGMHYEKSSRLTAKVSSMKIVMFHWGPMLEMYFSDGTRMTFTVASDDLITFYD